MVAVCYINLGPRSPAQSRGSQSGWHCWGRYYRSHKSEAHNIDVIDAIASLPSSRIAHKHFP
jgi:hypothetical protein